MRRIVLSLFFCVLPHCIHAQSYPKQPINLIIPLAPGDATDVAGRTIGEGLSKLLKVPVVAVNRPGAGGTIGTDSAVKAPKTATPFSSPTTLRWCSIASSRRKRCPTIRTRI